MNRSKRLVSVVMSFFISLSSLLAISVPHAFATARAWDGSSGDGKFSTAANWSGDAVPTTGDTLTFDMTVPVSYETALNNDIVGLSVAGITLTGAGSNNKSFAISGNALTLTGPITESQTSGNIWMGVDIILGADMTFTGSKGGFYFGGLTGHTILDLTTHSFTLNVPTYTTCPITSIGSLKGSGNVIITAGNLYITSPKDVYTGSVTANAGELALKTGALGAGNTVTVNGTSQLTLATTVDAPFAMPVVMNSSANPSLASYQGSSNACSGAGGYVKHTATLSGSLTLNADTIFNGENDVNVTGTYTANAHTLSTKSGSTGSITTSAGTVETPAKTTTIAEGDVAATTDVYAGNKETLVLDGERRGITLGAGSILKGAGKMDSLYANIGSTVAPGHSPGKLTVVTNLQLASGSTYEAELKSTIEYDQIMVTGTTASVDVTDAILKGLIVEGFKMKAGDVFTIIDNGSTSGTVTGTFKDMPEGTTFKISDGVFKISYVGGSGNDVTLTVVTVPTVANTGAHLLTSSLLMIVAGTLALTAGAYGLGRRFASLKA